MTPNFSARAYPWGALRRLTRAEATCESALARWVSAARVSSTTADVWQAERLRRLLRLDTAATVAVRVGASARGPSTASTAGTTPTSDGGAHTVVGHAAASRGRGAAAANPVAADPIAFPSAAGARDPFAASCEVRIDGLSLQVRGSSAGLRAIAQRMIGGPAELAAPRPLGVIEQSLWCLVVATALEDLGIAGEVWPQFNAAIDADAIASEIDAQLGDIAIVVELRLPPSIVVRVPTPRATLPRWLDHVPIPLPLIVGRCAIARADLERLAPRSLVTLDRPESNAQAELEVFGGTVGLKARPGALAAEVVTGYVRRDMALPDEAHVELTVALGTTQLSLRQITELAVGQIVQLGRPLGGPFELRAAGRVLGRGELVDVDGELAVRIVSLGD